MDSTISSNPVWPFKVPLEKLSLDDLKEFFGSPQKESTIIEFKSFDERSDGDTYEKIFKTICAFLNSEGGVIVWGAPKESEDTETGEKVCVGHLCPIPKKLETLRVYHKVRDSIRPASRGFEFKNLGDGEKNYYVFFVQKSNFAPHQYDNRYYIRNGPKTDLAPDHVIKSMVHKVPFPRLEGFLTFNSVIWTTQFYFIPVSIRVYNHSPFTPEKDLTIFVRTEGVELNTEKDQIDIRKPINDLRTMRQFRTMPIIHIGMVYEEHAYLRLPLIKRQHWSKNFTVAVIFSGDYSPPIISEYEVRLDAYYGSGQEPELTILPVENVFVFEKNNLENRSPDQILIENLTAHNKFVEESRFSRFITQFGRSNEQGTHQE